MLPMQGLMLLLQNLPTSNWTDSEISLVVAEAFRLKYMFADAPKHLSNSQQQQQTLGSKWRQHNNNNNFYCLAWHSGADIDNVFTPINNINIYWVGRRMSLSCVYVNNDRNTSAPTISTVASLEQDSATNFYYSVALRYLEYFWSVWFLLSFWPVFFTAFNKQASKYQARTLVIVFCKRNH